MEKQLGWACKLGGMECQDLQVGANSVSEVDGVSVVAPAFQLCASVVGGAEMWNRLVPYPHLVDKNLRGISWEQGVPAQHQAPQPRVPVPGR